MNSFNAATTMEAPSTFSNTSLPSERVELDDLTANDVESSIITLFGRLSTATFDLLVLIGEYDARGTWAARGALSCAAWLVATCDIEIVTARNYVRVAKAMLAYPALHAAMAEGDISFSKARMLIPHLSDAHEHELVELAATTPASLLAVAIAAWSYRNETDDETEQRHRRARFMTWRTDPDGMVTFIARLAPADAAGVCAAIDQSVTTAASKPRGGAIASADVADAPMEAREYPSLGQQRADALVRVIAEPGVDGRGRTEIVVHVRDDGNSLSDGTPLTDNAVTRMLPEAFISLLLHDADRKPIDASPRRRLPTARQRRVLNERFAECAYPGCHARVFLQADHITAFDDAGPTIIENLQLLCGPHNRAKERARTKSRFRTSIKTQAQGLSAS